MFATPDVNSTVQLLQYENTVLLDGMLGIGILILVWVVLFVRMSGIGSEMIKSSRGFTVASFVTGILSVLLYSMELITDITLIFCLLLAVVSVVVLVSVGKD